MKKLFIAACFLFSANAFAQNNEKPADASATKLNTVRTKEVTTGEVKTKNVTTAPTSGVIDQAVPERQSQGNNQNRVKPAIVPTTTKAEGEK